MPKTKPAPKKQPPWMKPKGPTGVDGVLEKPKGGKKGKK